MLEPNPASIRFGQGHQDVSGVFDKKGGFLGCLFIAVAARSGCHRRCMAMTLLVFSARRLVRGIVSELDYSPANSDGDCLRAIAGTKFLHNVLNVRFDGLFRDKELFGNIPVAISASEMTKNLHLAHRKAFVAVMFSQGSRDLGRDTSFPRMDLANYAHQFAGRHTLKNICASSGLKCPSNFDITSKGRQHDDTGIWKFRPYGNRGIDATHVGKS